MVTPASIEKKELTKLNSAFTKAEIENQLKSLDSSQYNSEEAFRLLINGLFQAEGHIGGEFLSHNKRNIDSLQKEIKQSENIKFRPIVFISLNASSETIKLFKRLNSVFNNKLNFLVTLNKSGLYHIRIYTRKWDIIINKWIPYFKNCYGDKQRGLLILRKLYYLSNKSNQNNNEKLKILYLIYNLVDNSQIKISLIDRVRLVFNDKSMILDNEYLEEYLKNTICIKEPEMSILFILGFYLGDGTFSIFTRYSGKGLQYRPTFRILQKYTKDNYNLLLLIQTYLIKYNINSHITISNNKVLITVDSNKSSKLLNNLFTNYKEFYYNKSDEFNLWNKSCLLLGKVKFWREANLILLRLIYEYNNNKENYDEKVNIINKYFNETQKDTYFIYDSKNTSYMVTLPIKVKPRQKYFFYVNSKSVMIKTKEETLLEAKNYRDKTLNQWLIENKLI